MRKSKTETSSSDRQLMIGLVLLVVVMWLLMMTVLAIQSRKLAKRSASLQSQQAANDIVSVDQIQALDAFSSEVILRSNHVHNVCSSLFETPYAGPTDHYIFDRKKGILYCAVPLGRRVQPLSLLFSARFRQYRVRLDSDGNIVPDFLLPQQLQDAEPIEDYPIRILVVRNPADRLVSFYRDHLEDTSSSHMYYELGQLIIREHRDTSRTLSSQEVNDALMKVDDDPDRERVLGNPYATPTGPTFTEFAQYVVAHTSDVSYYAPYHEYCAPCTVHYNFILRFENITEEGDLLRLLVSPNEERINFSDDNSSPSSLDELCSYFSQLDDSLFKQLLLMFKPDFILFNYSIDEILSCADEYVRQ